MINKNFKKTEQPENYFRSRILKKQIKRKNYLFDLCKSRENIGQRKLNKSV